jgi:predicted nuclease of predicted toxin-antitoxin system
MKLLFDQNLSFKLCERLADLFPDSSQVRLAGLETADDRAVWEFAKSNDLAIFLSGFRFCGHGSGVRAAAQGHLVALRQSNKRRHRKNVPRSRWGDHRLWRGFKCGLLGNLLNAACESFRGLG